MAWIDFETVWFIPPAFANELIWREASERLEPASKVVGVDEVAEMASALVVIFVLEAADGGVLYGPVHPLDLSVRPGMVGLGEALLDGVGATEVADRMAHVTRGRAVAVLEKRRELDAVIRQDRVHAVGNRFDQCLEEGARRHGGCTLLQPREHELARPVNGYEQVQFAFGRTQLGIRPFPRTNGGQWLIRCGSSRWDSA